jgi:Mg/Co/Ni transporter MgtE
MASDDAADLLFELDQERRLPILNLMPAREQRKLRALLGHNPETAGGMMNPDFVSAGTQATVAEALASVRASELGAQPASIVCVTADDGTLAGALSLADLIRALPTDPVCNLVDESPIPTVPAEADLPEVARLMTDYNLIAIPVLDGDSRPVGIIAVDDVLERLLPEEWRRRAGVARD